jgi:hypothetical protein
MKQIRLIWSLGLILTFFLEGCVPAREPLQGSPATTSTASSVPPTAVIQPAASPTQESALTPAETAASTPQPAATFSADIYPPPLPFLQPVNGIEAAGCPDLTAVEPMSSVPEILKPFARPAIVPSGTPSNSGKNTKKATSRSSPLLSRRTVPSSLPAAGKRRSTFPGGCRRVSQLWQSIIS